MTTHQDITARLRAEAAGIEEWAIMDPATGAFCISFDRYESVNPAREAAAWLETHKRDWPETFGKCEVVRQVRKSARGLLEIEAAVEIDRLRLEVKRLRDLVVALKVDAERLDWLAEEAQFTCGQWQVVIDLDSHHPDDPDPPQTAFVAAIDAARKG